MSMAPAARRGRARASTGMRWPLELPEEMGVIRARRVKEAVDASECNSPRWINVCRNAASVVA
eukprot:COSAG02_NODE_1492_length_12334_cov_29.721945_1_plen_63_part_00